MQTIGRTPVAQGAGSAPQTGLPTVWIRPSRGWVPIKVRDLWEYRELIYFLVWRDVKARYKQTVFGAAWAILQPLLTMVIFSVFFGRLARIPSDGVPYPIFALAGLVPWMFFSNGLNQSANSLVHNSDLLKKVYFPRLAMPLAAVLAGLIDFVLAFAVLLGMMFAYGRVPTAHVLWLPGLVALALTTALGMGLWLATLNVEFRDVRHVVPFLVQVWLFATPVVYPSSLLPQPWRTLYGVNPMAGVVEGFRWALLGKGTPPGLMLAISACVALMLLMSGALYLRRMEKTFADVV